MDFDEKELVVIKSMSETFLDIFREANFESSLYSKEDIIEVVDFIEIVHSMLNKIEKIKEK